MILIGSKELNFRFKNFMLDLMMGTVGGYMQVGIASKQGRGFFFISVDAIDRTGV